VLVAASTIAVGNGDFGGSSVHVLRAKLRGKHARQDGEEWQREPPDSECLFAHAVLPPMSRSCRGRISADIPVRSIWEEIHLRGGRLRGWPRPVGARARRQRTARASDTSDILHDTRHRGAIGPAAVGNRAVPDHEVAGAPRDRLGAEGMQVLPARIGARRQAREPLADATMESPARP